MSETVVKSSSSSPATLLAGKLELSRKSLQKHMLSNCDAQAFLRTRYIENLAAGNSVATTDGNALVTNSVQANQFVQLDIHDLPEAAAQNASVAVDLSVLRLFPGFLLEVAQNYAARSSSTSHADLTHLISQLAYARQQMIAGNLGLVGSIAHQYRATSIGHDDLLQEGVLGLIKAVDRFDVERGYQFSTYASYWIKQAISRLITKQDRIVHLPISVAEKAGKVVEAMRSFFLKHERWPTLAQLLRDLQDFGGLTEDEIKAIHAYYQAHYSLDASSSSEEGDGLELMTRMRQQQFALPLDELIEGNLNSYLNDAVASLPAKEADIINMRFGLKNHTEMTLQAVADHLQVTRERVRQIQNQALGKLRARFGFDLMPFLEANDGYQ